MEIEDLTGYGKRIASPLETNAGSLKEKGRKVL